MRIILAITFLFSIATTAVASGYDIIIAVGQSNHLAGDGDPAPPCEFPIWQVGRHDGKNMQIIPALHEADLHHIRPWPHRVGFDYWFACLYAEKYLEEGRKVLVVPGARSATDIVYWFPGDDALRDLIDRVNLVLAQPGEHRVVAIVSQIGERDSGLETPRNSYVNRYSKMLTALWLRYGDVPVLMGRMLQPWRHGEQRKIDIELAQGDLAIGNPLIATVPSDGLLSNGDQGVVPGDTIHFSAVAQRKLARRYMMIFDDMVQASSSSRSLRSQTPPRCRPGGSDG